MASGTGHHLTVAVCESVTREEKVVYGVWLGFGTANLRHEEARQGAVTKETSYEPSAVSRSLPTDTITSTEAVEMFV
jgi:hypothetical protein